MNVVGIIVENRQLLDVADDHAEIDPAVGRRPRRPPPQVIVLRVVIVGRRDRLVAGVHAVNVGQENVTRLADDPHLILHVQRQLKIAAPVLAIVPVVGQHGILEEDPQSIEVLADAIQHDNVRRNDEEVAGQRRLRLVRKMEKCRS